IPASLVVSSIVTPVSVFRMVTLTPGITAPVESVTVPRRSAELVLCATAPIVINMVRAAISRARDVTAGHGLLASLCLRRAGEPPWVGVFLICFLPFAGHNSRVVETNYLRVTGMVTR